MLEPRQQEGCWSLGSRKGWRIPGVHWTPGRFSSGPDVRAGPVPWGPWGIPRRLRRRLGYRPGEARPGSGGQGEARPRRADGEAVSRGPCRDGPGHANRSGSRSPPPLLLGGRSGFAWAVPCWAKQSVLQATPPAGLGWASASSRLDRIDRAGPARASETGIGTARTAAARVRRPPKKLLSLERPLAVFPTCPCDGRIKAM
jgi:hypothetical protein